MIYYKFVDFDGYHTHKIPIVNYVAEQFANTDEFYNQLDNDVFENICPEKLYTQIINFGGEIFRCMVFKLNEKSILKFNTLGSIHTDAGIATYRLNLPLLNAESIETKFFKVLHYNPESRIVNRYNVPTEFFKETDCAIQDSYIMNNPLVINVKEPHGLYVNTYKWPRYIMSIQFKSDHHLRDFMVG